MNKHNFLLLAFLLIISAATVLAADNNVLEPLVNVMDSLKIAENYDKFPYAIDFFIAMFIFIGVAQKILKDRLGKPAAVGIGLALSVALVSFEVSSGGKFRLGAFGVYAALLLLLIFGFFMYQTLTSMGAKTGGAAATAIVITYLALQATAPSIFDWIREEIPLLEGIMVLVLFWAVVQMFMFIARLFRKGSTGEDKGDGWFKKAFTPTPEEKHAAKEADDVVKTELKEKKTEDEMQKLNQLDEHFHEYLTSNYDKLQEEIKYIRNFLAKILSALKNIRNQPLNERQKYSDQLNSMWAGIVHKINKVFDEMHKEVYILQQAIAVMDRFRLKNLTDNSYIKSQISAIKNLGQEYINKNSSKKQEIQHECKKAGTLLLKQESKIKMLYKSLNHTRANYSELYKLAKNEEKIVAYWQNKLTSTVDINTVQRLLNDFTRIDSERQGYSKYINDPQHANIKKLQDIIKTISVIVYKLDENLEILTRQVTSQPTP